MVSKSIKLQKRTDLHLSRKLWHISSGLGLLYAHSISGNSVKESAQILILFSLFSFLFEFSRTKISTLNDFVLNHMGTFMRECERNKMSGLPFYTMGIGLSAFLFNEQIAYLSILFLIFSDPLSSTIGILYGKTKVLKNKSLEGSIAGLLCCSFITFILLGKTHPLSIDLALFVFLAGIVGMLSELMSIVIDDNFSIPLVSGVGITAINLLFNLI